MHKEKVLITGNSGFIGSRLSNRLERDGYEIYGLSRSAGDDICQSNSFDRLTDVGISTVFHLAGESFIPASWERPGNFYYVNVVGTQNVLDFCKKCGAKLVYISTYVYGIPQYLPIDEKHPVLPNNPYAHSKWLGEELCRFYSANMGVLSTILRPFNIYGAGQSRRYLIPGLIEQIKATGRVEVHDLEPKRDYLHISDFINACVLAMSYKMKFDIFNVGCGKSHSVADVIDILTKACDGQLTFRATGEKRRNEISDTVADCRHIANKLGWRAGVSLETGLTELLRNESAKEEVIDGV